MSGLLATFLVALLLSYLLTPEVGEIARRWGLAVDEPSARKVHDQTTPRTGGVAIYVAFMAAFLGAMARSAGRLDPIAVDQRTLALVAGASLAFALGLWDDARPLKPTWKLVGHVAAALVAYAGGIQIVNVTLPWVGEFSLGWLSIPATVLWFVLIINALNLIDGLDGLAAGITLFAVLVLLSVLDSTGSHFDVAVGLAALGGAALGFLRHNFHPASIFLGDSGSYFLGYNLAALSVLGSIKGHTTVAIFIPIIALGVPVMDALWAPVRRVILGQRMFHPDMDHIHHRLLKLGYTHRRAVLILYAITILMGLVALSLVRARDDRAALTLALVGAGSFFGIRKLGYLGSIHRAGLAGRLRTVDDELGRQTTCPSWPEGQRAHEPELPSGSSKRTATLHCCASHSSSSESCTPIASGIAASSTAS